MPKAASIDAYTITSIDTHTIGSIDAHTIASIDAHSLFASKSWNKDLVNRLDSQ
ncbi:hypothetical protein F2Q68_00031535 [Brassica cretica]|uniref:Uncharacterized protein n=1 Tax=Brassica cretica TaxID=69181 RepID=A0A8S9G4T0_BRACR|nr:hypothetical protein F2Q68_00031535 [Brassica cretica]